jgi:hypothetical protein
MTVSSKFAALPVVVIVSLVGTSLSQYERLRL